MKSILRVILVLTGLGILVGIGLWVSSSRTISTADDYRAYFGAGVLVACLLPFTVSLGFYKLITIAEEHKKVTEVYLDLINDHIMDLKKQEESR